MAPFCTDRGVASPRDGPVADLRLLLALVANAIGLLVAALVLDDMSLDAASFIVEVAVFTVVVFVIQPLIIKQSLQSASALAGSSALLATLVGLIVTSVTTDGLQIRGAGTWVMATIIVWSTSLIGSVVLPAIFLKQKVSARRA